MSKHMKEVECRQTRQITFKSLKPQPLPTWLGGQKSSVALSPRMTTTLLGREKSPGIKTETTSNIQETRRNKSINKKMFKNQNRYIRKNSRRKKKIKRSYSLFYSKSNVKHKQFHAKPSRTFQAKSQIKLGKKNGKGRDTNLKR
ncbi:hypothetical protein S245_037569 [Arachis hypogaea]